MKSKSGHGERKGEQYQEIQCYAHGRKTRNIHLTMHNATNVVDFGRIETRKGKKHMREQEKKKKRMTGTRHEETTKGKQTTGNDVRVTNARVVGCENDDKDVTWG
jgi:hypothetical protein